MAFEIEHFLDSRSSDFWCPVFLKGGKNEENSHSNVFLYLCF